MSMHKPLLPACYFQQGLSSHPQAQLSILAVLLLFSKSSATGHSDLVVLLYHSSSDVILRFAVAESLSAALLSLWLLHNPGTVGTASVQPLPACHGMGSAHFSVAQGPVFLPAWEG